MNIQFIIGLGLGLLLPLIYFFRSRNGKIFRALRSRAIGIMVKDVANDKILVDWKDNCVSYRILRKGYWEKEIMHCLEVITPPGGNVVSLGGHIGYHVIKLSQLVGNQGKIFAFEANPKTFKFLQFNLILNELKNITAYNKAVWSQEQTLNFAAMEIGQGNTGKSHVFAENTKLDESEKVISVEAVSLDKQLESLQQLDLLQMDIEGSEIPAVRGAEALIVRSPHLKVLQEWNVAMMAQHGSVSEYIQFWRRLGYQFGKITHDRIIEQSCQQLLQPNGSFDVVIVKNLQEINQKYQA